MVRIIKKGEKNKDENAPEEKVSSSFDKNFEKNLNKFKEYLKDSDDAVIRQFTSIFGNKKCAVIFIDGLTDKDLVQKHIIKPLIFGSDSIRKGEERYKTIFNGKNTEVIIGNLISAAEIEEIADLDKAMLALLSGGTIIIMGDYDKVIKADARKWETRGVQEPETEYVVRGPRDGLTETLRFNTALIRRRIRDVNLVMKYMSVGRRSKTDVVITYIKGIARPELVDEIKKRIEKIDIDDISSSGEIEQLIEENTLTPFPQIQNTERPDRVAAAITEGRVAVLVDGVPFALIIPVSLYQFFQSPEDHYERWLIGSAIRILRLIGSFLATFAPGLYVAIVSYHPGMLPTTLALSIAASRETVPFPAFVEALLMEVTIELLREAGARLPKGIGETIGIVGGIIIGDAAVRAGLVSPFMVIVVAITAISSFIIPAYNVAISFRLMRFPVMVLAGILGLYGVMFAFIFTNIHLVMLKSFGVNYLSPIAPIQVKDWKDFFIRLPIRTMKRRPEYINPIDIYRLK